MSRSLVCSSKFFSFCSYTLSLCRTRAGHETECVCLVWCKSSFPCARRSVQDFSSTPQPAARRTCSVRSMLHLRRRSLPAHVLIIMHTRLRVVRRRRLLGLLFFSNSIFKVPVVLTLTTLSASTWDYVSILPPPCRSGCVMAMLQLPNKSSRHDNHLIISSSPHRSVSHGYNN